MARTTRRRVLRLTGASALTVALALPAGPVTATLVPRFGGEAAADSPADPAPPPSEPPPSPPPAPTPSTPPNPPPPGPSTPNSPTAPPPRPSAPGTPSKPDGTPEPGDSPDPDGPAEGDSPAYQASSLQKKATEQVTAELNEKKQKAPAELVPSVEQLTATLRAVETPHTPPQDRDAVIRGAQAVSSTLDVISRPGTPPALRERLTGLVRQVVSTLGAGNDPGTPAPDRRAVFLIAEGSASVLGVIGDRRTPQGLREDLAGIVHDVTSVATGRAPGSPGDARRIRGARTGPQDTESLEIARSLADQLRMISDPGTSGEGRKDVARATHDASSSLDGANRSGASDEDRDQARKKLHGRLDRARRKVEKYLSAQSLPDVRLGEAAVRCTDSVFEVVPEAAVGRHVGDLLPKEWGAEGVKNFWKSQERDSDFLEVFTQLRNEKMADAPARIAQLIPRLADVVPAGDLFWVLGPPSLHCLRAAAQLDEYSGIESGGWVKKAEEME